MAQKILRHVEGRGINLLNLNFSAQKKLTKAEEECQKSFDYKKKSELTKALCLELESQIKEYEIVIERMEKVQQKLKESNEDLKTKADTSGSDLIKVNKVQIFLEGYKIKFKYSDEAIIHL